MIDRDQNFFTETETTRVPRPRPGQPTETEPRPRPVAQPRPVSADKVTPRRNWPPGHFVLGETDTDRAVTLSYGQTDSP